MKSPVIVGGLGPESTIEYYRFILDGYRARVTEPSSLQIENLRARVSPKNPARQMWPLNPTRKPPEIKKARIASANLDGLKPSSSEAAHVS